MTDTFSNRPSTATERKVARVRTAGMGDGYEQRQLDGLNPILMQFDLVFADVPLAEGDAIEAFIDAHLVLAFNWTPPRKAQGLYVCDAAYDRVWNPEVEGDSTITCKFRQVVA